MRFGERSPTNMRSRTRSPGSSDSPVARTVRSSRTSWWSTCCRSPRSERIRPVHVVANDTLVESPLVIGHVKEGLAEIRRASAAFDLPVVVATTAPSPDQTFWVNLIGRGYPSPNRFVPLVHRSDEDTSNQPIRPRPGEPRRRGHLAAGRATERERDASWGGRAI